jgi:hypothetical protein
VEAQEHQALVEAMELPEQAVEEVQTELPVLQVKLVRLDLLELQE